MLSKELEFTLNQAFKAARDKQHEFMTIEHLLLALVDDELRNLAAARMAKEDPAQTMQATALVHEAYLRLVGGNDMLVWENRRHFFGAAARAMRGRFVRSRSPPQPLRCRSRRSAACIAVSTATPLRQPRRKSGLAGATIAALPRAARRGLTESRDPVKFEPNPPRSTPR